MTKIIENAKRKFNGSNFRIEKKTIKQFNSNDSQRSDSVRKKIGILTSGGDSSGMNAAVRAITRFALHKGCIPFAILEHEEHIPHESFSVGCSQFKKEE